MRSFVRKYFGFSKSETNGFIILIPTMMLLLFAPNITKRVLLSQKDEQQNVDKILLINWMNELNGIVSTIEEIPHKAEAFTFNPNQASTEDLKRLGFSDKTSERIDKYRKAGGKFKSKQDLQKIYGISESRLKELSNFISIPKKERQKPPVAKKKKPVFKRRKFEKRVYNFELNTVSADSLIKIHGIGPFYARNIVQHRDKLGGFANLQQLNEVYKMNPDIFKIINENTVLNIDLIKPVDLNSDSAKILFRHPYISYKLAQAIIAYKNQHGSYKQIEELKNIKLVSDSLYLRLRPYLHVSNI